MIFFCSRMNVVFESGFSCSFLFPFCDNLVMRCWALMAYVCLIYFHIFHIDNASHKTCELWHFYACCKFMYVFVYEPRHDKTNKVTVHPAKTQISLGIRPVWSESSLSAWRKAVSLATHWAHSEDSDQTGTDAQADLSLRWAHTQFVGYVMSRLIFLYFIEGLDIHQVRWI